MIALVYMMLSVNFSDISYKLTDVLQCSRCGCICFAKLNNYRQMNSLSLKLYSTCTNAPAANHIHALHHVDTASIIVGMNQSKGF